MILGAAALAAAAPLAVFGPGAQAQVGGDLSITPKRLVFAPGANTATVFVINRGAAPVSYDIGLVDRTMLADGRILAADDPAAKTAGAEAALKSAAALLTFTPRRVTLGPGESQTIRVRVLRPADLADGEYRSHLTVTAIPPPDAGLTAEQAANQAAGQVGVRLTALFSLSIPVIVRQGAVDSGATLENPVVAVRPREGGGQQAVLRVDLVRKGANSAYGDIEIRDAKAAKSAAPLGTLRGVAVYPEIGRRAVEVQLAELPAKGRALTVTFKDDDTKPGQIIATASVTVP